MVVDIVVAAKSKKAAMKLMDQNISEECMNYCCQVEFDPVRVKSAADIPDAWPHAIPWGDDSDTCNMTCLERLEKEEG
jgi:hypothetical protein